jgi:hypothetical protein
MAAPGAPSKTRLQVTTPEAAPRPTRSPDTDREGRLHHPCLNREWFDGCSATAAIMSSTLRTAAKAAGSVPPTSQYTQGAPLPASGVADVAEVAGMPP